MWRRSRTIVLAWSPAAASGSPFSSTADASRRSRTCASTRADPSARARSSTAASPAPGTAINTCRTPGLRHRRSRRRWLPTGRRSSAGRCSSIRSRYRRAHECPPRRFPMPEFYVGYLPVPAGLKNFARRVVAALGVIAAGIAILLVFEQSPFGAAAFEFRDYREFQGVLVTTPYPALVVPGGLPWLLVGQGKHGFAAPDDFHGRTVRIRGERILHGADRAIEVQTLAATGPGERPVEIDLGRVELTGEIVDSKCYFGVMNPGSGKVHRDCAVRCLSGGIPPALLVSDASGRTATVLLANLKREWLEHIAEPVIMHGRLVRSDGRLILYAE